MQLSLQDSILFLCLNLDCSKDLRKETKRTECLSFGKVTFLERKLQ